jgi:hypothetical protein
MLLHAIVRRLAWYKLVHRAMTGGDLPCCPQCAGVGPKDPVSLLYEQWAIRRGFMTAADQAAAPDRS